MDQLQEDFYLGNFAYDHQINSYFNDGSSAIANLSGLSGDHDSFLVSLLSTPGNGSSSSTYTADGKASQPPASQEWNQESLYSPEGYERREERPVASGEDKICNETLDHSNTSVTSRATDAVSINSGRTEEEMGIVHFHWYFSKTTYFSLFLFPRTMFSVDNFNFLMHLRRCSERK